MEHVLVAGRALGRPVPLGSPVHHVNGDRADNRPRNLVICQDTAYHNLIEARTRAWATTGDADQVKCVHCKQFDRPENLYIQPNQPYNAVHRRCRRLYQRA
jgi:hypothetical protein